MKAFSKASSTTAKQTRKLRRNLIIGLALVISSLLIVNYLPIYIDLWRQSLGWIVVAFLVITFLSPVGHYVIGNPEEKIPILMCLQKTFVAYIAIAIFVFSFFLLLMTNIETLPADVLYEMLENNVQHLGYDVLFYPWFLYVFGVILIGGIAYRIHRPKMSGVLASIVPTHQLNGLLASVIDFMSILGFYILLQVLIGMSIFALMQFVCSFMGYHLDFHIDLTILGLGFALIYLPISSLWKIFRLKLEKARMNPGAILLSLLLAFSVFVLLMYVVLHLFLNNFASYFGPLESRITQINLGSQLNELSIANLLWGFSMISMAVVSGWWAQWLQGYTVRQIIIFLLLPLFLGAIIYQTIQINGISFQDLQPIILWIWQAPHSFLIGLLPAILLIIAFWRQGNFVNGIFWVFPNVSGRKLRRLSKMLMLGSIFIAYSAMFNLLTGIYFLKTILLLFAVMATFALTIVMVSYTKYLLTYLLKGKSL